MRARARGRPPRGTSPALLAGYRARLENGTLAPDPAQARAAEALEALRRRLETWRPAARARWRRGLGLAPPTPPRSLWLHGGVGRGKTMLMDLFHAAAAKGALAARRAHFHAFMAGVHARLHAMRERDRARGGRAAADPAPRLAAALAKEAPLLCFDEFDVRDIADAMILARLFEALLDSGAVAVATSNRAPRELYPGGLQRELFLPFIALLEERFDLVRLDGGTDYRLRELRRAPVYFAPLGPAADRALDESFARLAGGAPPVAETLRVQGRTVTAPAAVGGIARFGFDDLCAAPLGPADYLAIAARFHTVFVAGVPKLAPEHRNEARRFAGLVDVFYDRGVKLVLSADAPPHALYPSGSGAFEFRRAASRLVEMQTAAYLQQPHAART